MRHLALITFAIVFSVSCAKNRGVEKLRYDQTRNIIPKDAFIGTDSPRDLYYSKVTVVRNSLDGGHVFAGYQSDMTVGYFDFSETKLTFKSVQGAYRGRETSLTSTPIIYVWPITHHEAQLESIDGKTTNKEIDDNRKHWKDRKNFKVDFSMYDVANMPGVDPDDKCWTVASKRQVEDSVELEPGYISFLVEVVFNRNCLNSYKPITNGHPTFTAQYRFSFRKVVPSDYQPMTYKGEQDEAMRKFGYFQSIFENENPKDGLPKNTFYINRWHPKKTHAFHFTQDFPEQYKYIYRDIFEKTNKVFAEKDLKIRFVLLENNQDYIDGKIVDGKPKKFGDLRYSFINQIEEIDPSAPLGYGPSDANPFTGEIIAANLNVWSGMIKYYLKVLEQSSKRNPEWFQNPANGEWSKNFENSKWANSDLFLRMKSVLNDETPDTWTQSWSDRSDLRSFFSHMVSYTTYSYPGFNMFTYGKHPFQSAQMIVEKPVKHEGTEQIQQLKQLQAYGVPFSNDGIMGAELNKTMTQAFMADAIKLHKHNDTTFVNVNPINYKPLEEMPSMKAISNLFGGSSLGRLPDPEVLKEFSHVMASRNDEMKKNISENRRGHCVIAAQESLAGVERFILEGISLDKIAENIIYRTSIHEFGHNLNLRHNFYGSVDKENFLPPSVPVQVAEYVMNEDGTPKIDPVTGKAIQSGKTKNVVDASGKQVYWPTVSSSVMDYLRLQDEYYSTQEWEPYDKAALWFAYSDGKVEDKTKNYLFCTDDHTITNALCNRFDRGTTPTEVVMSIIEAYEDGYYSRNYRFGRAYWNTTGYPSAIVSTMQELKEFLPMWRTAFYEASLREELGKKGFKSHQTEQMVTEISRDIKQAIRLSLAFYHSVLQTGAVDKPYRSEYDEFTGGIKRMGISFDKLAAIVFLAGDDQIYYNPNRVMIETSYLTYAGVPEFSKLMERIIEDIVTVRVDMEPWFISIGRQLYAQSAMDFSNRDNESFINQIKVKKYTAFELEQYFDYQPKAQLVTDLVTLKTSKDADFIPNETVALVRVNSNYYMFSQQTSPFAYVIYKKVKQSEEFEQSSVEGKLDIQELYYIYSIMSGGLP